MGELARQFGARLRGAAERGGEGVQRGSSRREWLWSGVAMRLMAAATFIGGVEVASDASTRATDMSMPARERRVR